MEQKKRSEETLAPSMKECLPLTFPSALGDRGDDDLHMMEGDSSNTHTHTHTHTQILTHVLILTLLRSSDFF